MPIILAKILKIQALFLTLSNQAGQLTLKQPTNQTTKQPTSQPTNVFLRA